MKLTKSQEMDRQAIIAKLHEWLKPGDAVSTVVRHVSRSGMSRQIACFVSHNGEVLDITWNVALALNERVGKHSGVVMGGCGMDMCFQVVYLLGRVLFPSGFAVEGRGHNGDTSGWDTDGGYALKNRTL
jgi:hypothetical protein